MFSYHRFARDASLFALALDWDRGVAEQIRVAGCDCSGALHRADYPRKPRGGPGSLGREWQRRLSFCCAEEGCRRRTTPPSVRFLGRRVYLAAIVVLASVVYGGLTQERARRVRQVMGVPRRTLERWLVWWREQFVDSPLWRGGRGLFAPPVDSARLPESLAERFGGPAPGQRLQKLLEFLSPSTTGSCRWKAGFSMGA